jgi:serine/threonine protein kinase/serine/threonine protein phosphatase PrpC
MSNSKKLVLDIGIISEIGLRQKNEDFADAVSSSIVTEHMGYAVAIADGMGSHKGGREAAEIVVRGFIEGYYDKAKSWDIRRSAFSVLESLNSWIYSMRHSSRDFSGMGCTFTGLIFRGRSAHLFHCGDSRLYRYGHNRLSRLTLDHTLDKPEQTHILYRAIGLEPSLRLDYENYPIEIHDRFLLCTDGIHNVLPDKVLEQILSDQRGSQETAREIVSQAIEAGSLDNATALIVDVLEVPDHDTQQFSSIIESLPLRQLPKMGETIDGFLLLKILSDGRYARLFLATDELEGGDVVLKFPRPIVVEENNFKIAFLKEYWVSALTNNVNLGRSIILPSGRQSCLYTVMPFYSGETLEKRVLRNPQLSLEDIRSIGIKLCHALISLHRNGIIHRDIKPDNIILDSKGNLHLIDFGVARIASLQNNEIDDCPGTASYMAPELFEGGLGDQASDIFSLGVTLFRSATGDYPYGEIEPFTKPFFTTSRRLKKYRPDLPSWLDYALAKAISVKSEDRYADMTEMLYVLENGPSSKSVHFYHRQSLYDRNPIIFWQTIVIFQILLILWLLAKG